MALEVYRPEQRSSGQLFRSIPQEIPITSMDICHSIVGQIQIPDEQFEYHLGPSVL